MSGIEIAGILLGAFPLIISGLEHWREVAKVGGFFWRVRKEYHKCRSDVQFHQIWYKRNMEELLFPVVNDADEVKLLVNDPGGKDWSNKALQTRLEQRLQESYGLYMDTIREMNETAEELKKQLSFHKPTVQSKLAPLVREPKQQRPPSTQSIQTSRHVSAKSRWDYETFRLKFSFNDPVRNELLEQLNKYNQRLEVLLGTSEKVSALQTAAHTHTKQASTLETIFKKTWKKSDLLFRALQKAWQCSCQQYHVANLRLEHRTLPEICFEVILMFSATSSRAINPWFCKALRCGQMIDCSVSHESVRPCPASSSSSCPLDPTPAPILSTKSARQKQVAFTIPTLTLPKIEIDIPIELGFKLCQLLGKEECNTCMGIIGHENESYHLHSFENTKRVGHSDPLTLNHILSSNSEGCLSRRQRYTVALLLASSVAQLQFTSWLRYGFTKEDVLFFPCEDDYCTIPYHEPFIRQGFRNHQLATSNSEANDCNFYALGILLLELCFGQRLEDHPLRQKYPVGDGEAKQAFDLLAAMKWSQGVSDEGGDDYASAVRWCFTGVNNANQSWRSEIVKNVVGPLEMCQKHFKTAAMS